MSYIFSAKIITVTILTWNEEENIARTLSRLAGFEKIVVVDSGSADKTVDMVLSFQNTELRRQKFDTHATQWNYTLNLCESEWVLSLDADYILTDEFIEEVKEHIDKNDADAYYANFDFVLFKKALKGNNTTPRAVLFRRKKCTYYDDGHTQRLHIDGTTKSFTNKILHDDRKPLSRWLYNQGNYSQKECVMLLQKENADLPISGRIRKRKIFAPAFIFFYCLIRKGMLFNGWRGWHYTLQRTLAEILISMRLTEEKFTRDEKTD